MKESRRNNILFLTIVYFVVYWITAFPAELYTEGSHDKIDKFCSNFNDVVFGIKFILNSIGLDLLLNSFIYLLLLCILNAILTVYFFSFLSFIYKQLFKKNKTLNH